MSEWHFMQCCKQDIIQLTSEEFYQCYGELLLWKLINLCSDGLALVRYPTDEELVNTIALIKNKKRCS